MNEKMSENMRIGEWLDTWFEVYTGEKAERTVEVYRDARRRLRCHYPDIEGMKLSDLKPVAFQRILNALGHKYSQTSCRHQPTPNHSAISLKSIRHTFKIAGL